MIWFFIILGLALILLEQHSLRHALDGITYDTYPSVSTLDPDEVFEVVTELANNRRLPVSFLRMQESLPHDLQPVGDVVLRRDNEQCRLVSTVFLKPRQRLKRTFKASMPARGRYFLRGATLYGGDFLGISQLSGFYPANREIVILPRRDENTAIGDTLGDFLGDISVNRFIMEDPILTLGFRDYTGREPQRAISWTQSAKMNKVVVKNYDHTLDLSVTLLLNVAESGGQPPKHTQIEACFSIARAVCELLEEKRVKYSIITNATSAGAMGLWSQIGEGLGPTHLKAILEGLGRATYDSTLPFSALAEKCLRSGEAGRSFILITPAITEEIRRQAARLEHIKGSRVLLLDPATIAPAQEES